VRVLDIVGSPVTAKRVALGETPYYLVIGREVSLEKLREMLRGWLGRGGARASIEVVVEGK
jgi:hypothetical protein